MPDTTNPHLDMEMHSNIEEAKNAVKDMPSMWRARTDFDRNARVTQDIRADISSFESPQLRVESEQKNGITEVGGHVDKLTPTNTTTYNSTIGYLKGGVASTTVKRENDESEEVYSHRFKNPTTANKFISLMAKQIINKAQNKQKVS